MLRNNKKLARLLTASLAVAALVPATAAAVPAVDGNTGTQPVQGQAVAAGGGSGVTPDTLTTAPQQHTAAKQDFPPKADVQTPQQHTAAKQDFPPAPQRHTAAKQDFPPTQVAPTPANMPQWPLNPTPIATHNGVKASPKSSDDGLSTDTIVLLILGGLALVAVAGLGFARSRAGRQRQLA
jgi:hypothetical protein